MYNCPGILILLFSALLPLLDLGAADKVTFRQRWEPGKTYRQEIVMNSQANLPAANGDGVQDTSIIQEITIQVTKEAGTGKKLAEVKFVSIKAMITSGGEISTYDSTDPAMSQPFLQQAFGTMAGKSFTLVYDKDDKFLELRVPEGDGATPLGDFRGPSTKQFAEAFQKSFEAALPDRPLAAGESYVCESRVEMPPTGDIKTKAKGRFDSTVQHEGRKHAKLVLDGTVELPAGIAAGGGKLTGEILFDLDRKVVTQNMSRQEMKVQIGGKENVVTTTTTSMLKGVGDTK